MKAIKDGHKKRRGGGKRRRKGEMRKRDSVSRFRRAEREGAWSNKTRSEGTKANTATRSLAPRATHSGQDKPYGKGGGETERRQAERRGGKRNSGSADANG